MNAVLKQYIIGLDELKKYINFQYTQKKLISKVKDNNYGGIQYLGTFVQAYKDFSSNQIFQYNTIIVSMYGYFESFIEESIKEYLNSLKECTETFNDMPVKIKENHSSLSALLIQNMKLPKYKEIVSEEEIIVNMNSCITKKSDYNLNVDAYTYHTANFRKGSIDEFFSKVGIDNISKEILKHPKFKSYLDENEIDSVNAFDIIDELAERRNQVAHGAEYELLSLQILDEYINFLKVYGEILISVLTIHTIEHRIEANKIIAIGDVIGTYGNEIVALNVEKELCIKKGDELYAKTNNPSEPIRYGCIESIYENDVEVESLKNNSNEKKEFTIKTDFKVSKKYIYYVKDI